MKPTRHLFISLLFLVFSAGTLYAQDKKFEFDKISPADFNSAASGDTSAEAVVVADIGHTRFEYGTKGFYLIFERKARIHILKPEGTSQATIVIPLYKDESDREKVASFKGFTYNLENGKVIKTKVRSEDIFLEKKNEKWDQQKVAMPAVRENSIIEFEYEVHSDFTFNLQPWTFQSSIPVNWSEYTVIIPEYFKYKILAQGYIPFDVSDVTPTMQRFTVHVESQLGVGTGANAREAARTDTYEPLATEYRWVATKVHALKPESYITTVENYLSRVEFELSTVTMPNSPSRSVLDNWETLNEKLLENEEFGRIVKKGNFISDHLPVITANATTDLEKSIAIYNHVKNRMKWNGNNGIFTRNPPRRIYDERVGSVADINLMMIAMLKEAGLKADPVILSTRSHGNIMEAYPILAKFNYVIAVVNIDTMSFLLDATSSNVPFNTLPERCLNGNGRVISKNNPGWIRLLGSETKTEYVQAEMKLSGEGSLTGTCTINSSGLSGTERRNAYKTNMEKEFIKDFKTVHNTWTVNNFLSRNLDTLEKPFTEVYTVEIPDGAQVAGAQMYLNVMTGLGLKKNPFNLEKRTYPVDFSCPVKEYKVIKIQIPEGWIVEELPKPAIISLPEKTSTFRFRIEVVEGTIQVSSILIINKTVYLPGEYEQLKEFFRLIAAKHAEQIVLKKV